MLDKRIQEHTNLVLVIVELLFTEGANPEVNSKLLLRTLRLTLQTQTPPSVSTYRGARSRFDSEVIKE